MESAPFTQSECGGQSGPCPTSTAVDANAIDAANIAHWSPEAVNRAIADRLSWPAAVAAAPSSELLRFYDGESHRHMFGLPRHIRTRLNHIRSSLQSAPSATA